VKMKAMYLEKPLQVVEKRVKKPEVKDGEVLVKVKNPPACWGVLYLMR